MVGTYIYYSSVPYRKVEYIAPPEAMTEWVEQHATDFSSPVWLANNQYSETINGKEKYYSHTYISSWPTSVTPYFVASIYTPSFQKYIPIEAAGKRVTYYTSPLYCVLHGETIPKTYEYIYEYTQQNGAKIIFKIGLGTMPIDTHTDQLANCVLELTEPI